MESSSKSDCPIDCPNRNKSAVGKGYSILALMATVPSVLIVACLFSLRLDYQCQGSNGCITKIEWQGWQGVPLEAIASALGTGLAIYATRDALAEKVGNLLNK
ncbi:hypothetical protein H6F74_05640 [Trichocoleus sp. FACHB-90]|uniref:hypothetical protein n=1 Tax=Cyanophyceae TaxID=3028117 RepID=UPI0016869DFB|nr:hypothetical protein [Trichocoleus sp. FACHB-90]MBD1925765.1 hypothetical protein [Trichocoleus sp. FACHB-90]